MKYEPDMTKMKINLPDSVSQKSAVILNSADIETLDSRSQHILKLQVPYG